MSYSVVIRLMAETDITDAAVWYESQRTGLGNEFLAEIDSAISEATLNPFRFPCVRRRPEVRRTLSNRFPYLVFFIRRDEVIIVFRVLHAARHDREWKTNVVTK